MFDEFDKEDDNWRPEDPKCIKVLKKLPGILFTIFVFSLIAFIVFRLVISKPPKSMKEMIWTEATLSAYEQAGNDFKVEHILCSDSFSEDGMFSVSQITYCKAASQLQVTLRYNDRSMAYLTKDYPDAESAAETYRFLLRNDKNVRYTSYLYSSDAKNGYTYRHLIFDGVSLTDVSAMYLDVYYSGDYQPTEKARHTLYVYRYDFSTEEYDAGKPELGKYELKEQNE